MPSGAIGVYLGTDNVDLVALSGTLQRPRLVNFGRIQLPAEVSWHNMLRAEESGASAAEPVASPGGAESLSAIGRPIQALLEKTDLASARLHTAVASESVVIRYFQMPSLPARERKMAVTFEAKKYLPFKLEDLVTDFQVVTHKSDPTLMRVMFFGMKRTALTSILAVLESAKARPLSVEPAPISLLRLVRQTGQIGPSEVAALLHLEQETATINIVRPDLLYLSRNVTTLGTGQESGQSEGDGGSALLEAIINETRVSLDYYRRRFLGEPSAGKVILFGKELSPEHLQELGKALELPVETADPFKKISEARNLPPGLAVATGLALRGLEKGAGKINLLPDEKRGQEESLLKPLIMQTAAAAAILGVWYGVSAFHLNQQKERLRLIRSQQIQVPHHPPGAPIEQLQAARQRIRRESGFFDKIRRPEGIQSAIMSALTRRLPKEAWLEYAHLQDALIPSAQSQDGLSGEVFRALRLRGWAHAPNRDTELRRINGLLEALQEDPPFREAFSQFSLDSVQRGEFNGVEVTEFELTCATDLEEARRHETASTRSRRGRTRR